MMKTFLLLIFCCFTVISSCKKDSPSDVLIRISNKSQYQFENVIVNPFNQTNNYGTLNPGQNSGYIKFTTAYRYAYIKLTIQGKDFIMQPIDFVGETPLSAGKYTYELNVTDFDNRRLDLSFKAD